MDEDHNEIPDYSQDPHFPNSEEEEKQDSELLEVSEKTFLKENAHKVCPTVCGGKHGVATLYPRGQLPGHLNRMHI